MSLPFLLLILIRIMFECPQERGAALILFSQKCAQPKEIRDYMINIRDRNMEFENQSRRGGDFFP